MYVCTLVLRCSITDQVISRATLSPLPPTGILQSSLSCTGLAQHLGPPVPLEGRPTTTYTDNMEQCYTLQTINSLLNTAI